MQAHALKFQDAKEKSIVNLGQEPKTRVVYGGSVYYYRVRSEDEQLLYTTALLD